MSVSALDVLEQIENICRSSPEVGAPARDVPLTQVLAQAFFIQSSILSHAPQVLRQRSGLHVSDEQVDREGRIDSVTQMCSSAGEQLHGSEAWQKDVVGLGDNKTGSGREFRERCEVNLGSTWAVSGGVSEVSLGSTLAAWAGVSQAVAVRAWASL